MIRFFCFMVLFTFIKSCTNEGEQRTKRISVNGRYNSDGLEIDKWQYFDDEGDILEEGIFENGIRIGEWKYFFPENDTIFWLHFQNPNGSINTNVPKNLYLLENSDSISVFGIGDSSKLFKLVIAKEYSNSISNYKEKLFDDLSSLKTEIKDSISQYIQADIDKEYLFNYIVGVDSLKKNFYIFNIVGKGESNEIVEISLRCENRLLDRARRVFYSIIPNLFIDSSRFLNEQDMIKVFNQKY